MSKERMKEKIDFKAEVSQVLNLVVHSLYSHPEVFLRELVSNAADAIDKHRYLALSDEKFKAEGESAYAIRIVPNKKEKYLKISDNGIGMSREEVVQNIGTIASSGTRAFLEQMKANKKEGLELIGQFGVGFYSAFMVASSIKVETKRAGEDFPAICWESDGVGGYTMEETDKRDHGTEITLYLKEDALDYLEEYEIKTIVKKYSDYVSYPILLRNEKGGEETINKVSAIWRRSKSEVKEEEYSEFYKYISHDTEDPLLHCHHSMEGTLEYKMLLFIPQKAPLNFFREDIRGLRLHVKKMFITDECKDLLPIYLRFVKGVVDSEDLPLNISRETLQRSPVIQKMSKQLTKKIFDLLEELAEKEPLKYKTFFKELGVGLKEGVTSDFENRERLIELLRFQTSEGATAEDLISLKQYLERMKPDQKEIYYLSGSSREACEKSPHLEFFKKKGIEVLYLVDMIDEWVFPAVNEYKGKKFKSVSEGDLNLGELGKEAQKEKEKAEDSFKKLTERFRSSLQEEVKEVRLSIRLNESPCCLVVDEGDMNSKMEMYMKAMNQTYQPAKRILELNPSHPVIKNMQSLLEKNQGDPRISDWALILYNQALIAEGNPVKDPAAFVKKLSDLLSQVVKPE